MGSGFLAARAGLGLLERAKRSAMTLIDRMTQWARFVFAVLVHRALLLQAARLAAVGVVNTFVVFGVFLLSNTSVTSSLVGANTCSWLVAVSGSYVMNSMITFAAESGRQLSA